MNADTTTSEQSHGAATTSGQETLARIAQALRGLRYGEVRVVVHDGAIVRVERSETVRMPMPRLGAA